VDKSHHMCCTHGCDLYTTTLAKESGLICCGEAALTNLHFQTGRTSLSNTKALAGLFSYPLSLYVLLIRCIVERVHLFLHVLVHIGLLKGRRRCQSVLKFSVTSYSTQGLQNPCGRWNTLAHC
jgi:hypothetical protein